MHVGGIEKDELL